MPVLLAFGSNALESAMNLVEPRRDDPKGHDRSIRVDLSAWIICQNDEAELLSMSDVQAIFARSRSTISRWIREGYLAPVRRRREYLFFSDDIKKVASARLLKSAVRG